MDLEVRADGILVEVKSDGTLIPKAPYNSLLSLSRTLTVLGCTGFVSQGLRELELVVMETVTDPAKAAKFFAKLRGRLVTVGAIREALKN